MSRDERVRQVRVLHIITGLDLGGAETALLRLLAALPDAAQSHAVVSLQKGGVVKSRIQALNVDVFDLNIKPSRPNPLALLKLRQIVRKHRPDVIHAWMYHAALVAVLADRGTPVVAAIHHALHDWNGEKAGTRLVIRILAKLSHRFSAILYVSRSSMDHHEALGFQNSNAMAVPNGYDCEVFHSSIEVRQAVRRHLGLCHDSFVVGHVGRYHPVKNHASAARSFAAMAMNDAIDAKLVMVGGGVDDDNAELSNQLAELGVVDKVALLGQREDLPQLFNAFDVLVNSSLSEAFPNVLAEAMACGVPCVATDVGDSAYIVGDTGITVPPGDDAALAKALKQIAALPATERRARGECARRRIVENFSIELNTQKIQKLYQRIILRV